MCCARSNVWAASAGRARSIALAQATAEATRREEVIEEVYPTVGTERLRTLGVRPRRRRCVLRLPYPFTPNLPRSSPIHLAPSSNTSPASSDVIALLRNGCCPSANRYGTSSPE